jgi:hypothetical protein
MDATRSVPFRAGGPTRFGSAVAAFAPLPTLGYDASRRAARRRITSFSAIRNQETSMKTRLLVSCLLCVALTSCSGKTPQEPPVATARVSFHHSRVPLGSPVDITYRFTVSPQAKIDGNYLVFVHFLEGSSREMMWTDDHQPPVATSQWKPGQVIEYTRTMFTPVYPYVGEATVEVGLYKDKTRLSLAGGTDRGSRSYEMQKFEILPQTENVYLIYKDGWHQEEVAQGNPLVGWQWTKKEAIIAFRNPKRDVLFYLQVGAQPSAVQDPQTVSLRLGDQVVDTFPVKGETLRKVPLTAAQLGAGEMSELRIAVDRTFVPALIPSANNRDTRELGVCVMHAFVQPQ